MDKDSAPEVLVGWKEVANYLRKGLRTVQRYERELGLPVRRPAGKTGGSIIARKAELDAWLTACPIKERFALPTANQSTKTNIIAFRNTLADMVRLRGETLDVRHSLVKTIELLQNTALGAVPKKERRREEKRMG